jgi:hypothetical protein
MYIYNWGTNGNTKVFNKIIARILNYNRTLHISVGLGPFQVCLGFQPFPPVDVSLPIRFSLEEFSHAKNQAYKATKRVKQI